MINGVQNRRILVLGVLIFLLMGIGFQKNELYGQDSTRARLFGIKPPALKYFPLRLSGDSLNIQLLHPKPTTKLPQQFYDLKEVMPSNKFLWDYRESSYYTPYWVKNKIAQIMNRPTPNEVWPVWPVALIAAKLALQQLEIRKKIEIKPQDYLIERKYWPILKALLERSPQSAEELYQIDAIKKGRTLEILKQDLQFLVDQKLLKSRTWPGEPTVYFAAQSRGHAILLLENALQDDRFTIQQKKQFLDLKNYIVGDD